MSAPENVYRGELVAFPGAWNFQIGRSALIIVSDKEFIALSENPDKVLNLTLTYEKEEASLRQLCERAQAAGHRTLILSFDHFFSQYRPGQSGPRRLMPDMDEYIQRVAKISQFAEGYGLGLELSLLNPLEIGAACAKETGEAGAWMHYRKGFRDPKTGAFSVSLWRQKRWTNNKGVFAIQPAGVRVFAFRETPLTGTNYRFVDPNSIVEISDIAKTELLTRPTKEANAERIRIYGKGHNDLGDLNRVLVVQNYQTPEMDYFSPKSLPFLNNLVDKYADAGVKLNALYSDEAHIQQDWIYFGHHDNGEFALRYVSSGLANRYAELYGEEYRDFAKYLVYFVYGQEDYANDLSAKEGVQHVFGTTPEAIHSTALFRSRYYRLLHNSVVELFTEAKRHAEARYGYALESRAHATWAESPTIDSWRTGHVNHYQSAYEYTSNFIWSNTVHQASSACDDYFAWGDFLTGNGTDHPECGFLDRNYLGLSLACSMGILNEVPYSYCAHWGMPQPVSQRRMTLVNAFGAAGSPLHGLVQDMAHRDVEVLMLYPLNLVATEERFGSWMTQYGYANLITQSKLLERGKVVKGAIEIAGRRFTTLVVTFEPFPSKHLLHLMRELVEQGGRVVWSSMPPLLSHEGEPILEEWQRLFGVEIAPNGTQGLLAPGRRIDFEGRLQKVSSQTVLTDFLVDHLYPVTPRAGTETVARTKGGVVGTIRPAPNEGTATYLGYRPRDDQSKSLGYEMRNWFDVLDALEAYPATGTFSDQNDNTEWLSRNGEVLACRFPNGAISLAPHFRELEEDWFGGFARDAAQDAKDLERLNLPSERLEVNALAVNGRRVTYSGEQAVTFRVNAQGELIGFAGHCCKEITLDGKTFVFADDIVEEVAWGPVALPRRVEDGAVLQIMLKGGGTLHLPAIDLPQNPRIFAEGEKAGSRHEEIPSHIANGTLTFTVPEHFSGRWLYVTA